MKISIVWATTLYTGRLVLNCMLFGLNETRLLIKQRLYYMQYFEVPKLISL